MEKVEYPKGRGNKEGNDNGWEQSIAFWKVGFQVQSAYG